MVTSETIIRSRLIRIFVLDCGCTQGPRSYACEKWEEPSCQPLNGPHLPVIFADPGPLIRSSNQFYQINVPITLRPVHRPLPQMGVSSTVTHRTRSYSLYAVSLSSSALSKKSCTWTFGVRTAWNIDGDLYPLTLHPSFAFHLRVSVFQGGFCVPSSFFQPQACGQRGDQSSSGLP